MKCRSGIFKTVLNLLGILVLTAALSGCGGSKGSGDSNNGTNTDQPAVTTQGQSGDTQTASSIDYEKLLTPADVEKVTGLKGVITVAKNSQVGAGGKLNFAFDNDKDKLILSVMVEGKGVFDSWKESKDLNAAAVPNLGDEAFQGDPNNKMITPNVTFIKGEQSFQLFTFFNMNNDLKPYLTHQQLIDLAKIIEGNL